MGKRYIITNPKDVVELGIDKLILKFNAGKYEVQSDIAKFLYGPCYGVVEWRASYADVTAAFEYLGFPTREGRLTFRAERLIKFFEIEKEDEDAIFIRFKPDYEEDLSELYKKVRGINW